MIEEGDNGGEETEGGMIITGETRRRQL